MGKLSSHKHTPKNDDDDVDDASDKYGPPSQIALGMCAGFSFRGEKFPPRDKFFMNSFGAGDKKSLSGKLVWFIVSSKAILGSEIFSEF